MTPDEILAMKPGREMDALVAEKVMGWPIYPYYSYWERLGREYPHLTLNKGWDRYILWKESRQDGQRWLPSTSIADVWLVHDRIKELNKRTRFTQALCSVFLEDAEPRLAGDEGLWWMMATATPHQRCQAALLAVMESENGG